MKKVYTLLLFLSFVTSFSQRYSSDYWHDGVLYLERGDSIRVPLKYDLTNSVVFTNSDNKLKTWSASQIAGFKFIDGKTEKERAFKTIFIEKEDGFKIPVMFESVYVGKRYSLFRRDLVFVQSVNYNPYYGLTIPVSQRVENYSYYALNAKGDLEYFEVNKKSIINLFSRKEEVIKNYIKENKIKFKTTGDITRVFEFYNSL